MGVVFCWVVTSDVFLTYWVVEKLSMVSEDEEMQRNISNTKNIYIHDKSSSEKSASENLRMRRTVSTLLSPAQEYSTIKACPFLLID